MTSITIIGAGNIAQAVAGIAAAGGNQVQVLARDGGKATEAAQASGATAGQIGEAIQGDVVVLAVPYPALDDVLGAYPGALDGKIVVDPTNPLDFSTFDSLVVPADGSAAGELQAKLPGSHVLKAFNTTFAGTLASGNVGGADSTTVLIAGDDEAAKTTLADVVRGGGLQAVDAGALKRARELEALGFLQLTLAAAEKTSWTGGFALVN